LIAAHPGHPDDSLVEAEVAIVLADGLDGAQLSAEAFAHEHFTGRHYQRAKLNPNGIQSADS
jgi:hypothetical protein